MTNGATVEQIDRATHLQRAHRDHRPSHRQQRCKATPRPKPGPSAAVTSSAPSRGPSKKRTKTKSPPTPNPKNFLSQVYEYNKFLIHASSGAFMETFEAQRKTMLDMREELDKLRAREVEVFTLSQRATGFGKVEREKGMLKAATLAKSIDAGIGMIPHEDVGEPLRRVRPATSSRVLCGILQGLSPPSRSRSSRRPSGRNN